MTTLFEARHFNWLARWAGAVLTPAQTQHLADSLCSTNGNFKRDRFAAAVEKARAPAEIKLGRMHPARFRNSAVAAAFDRAKR